MNVAARNRTSWFRESFRKILHFRHCRLPGTDCAGRLKQAPFRLNAAACKKSRFLKRGRTAMHALAFGLILAALTLWWPCPASAQTPAEFYRGKTVELNIGTSAGGGYDVHSRLLARHMSKHMLGNPTIVPKNVEGASGVRLANLLYNTSPHDGTVFGILLRNVPFEPMFGNHAAQFDASKFTWIGSASSEVSVCVSWHTTGIATLDDLLTKDLIMGGIGSSSDLAVFPKIINGVLGTRMQVVNGYAGG